jgi:hypothetical protein
MTVTSSSGPQRGSAAQERDAAPLVEVAVGQCRLGEGAHKGPLYPQ